jgi:hypothetical protein
VINAEMTVLRLEFQQNYIARGRKDELYGWPNEEGVAQLLWANLSSGRIRGRNTVPKPAVFGSQTTGKVDGKLSG